MTIKRQVRWGFIELFLGLFAVAMLQGCFGPMTATKPRSKSLEAKIGQMLMVGFRGTVIDETHPITADIRDRHLGGVILFDTDVPTKTAGRNIKSPEQLQALTAQLQAVSPELLLIAVDQEGGRVARLKEAYGFVETLSHADLGGQNDLQATYKHATVIAHMLAESGINLNLAPVVDVCVNPDNPVIAKLGRCFSANPAVVAEQAEAFIQAHRDTGVLCCLKHFPGHGSSAADSHLGLTDVTETWTAVELEPYHRLIQAGAVDAVMTAHVFNATLDAQYPATLSKATIQGLLREKIQFDGVIVSDDMQMGAIARHYGFETAVQQAVLAGVDILIFANNSTYDPDIAQKAIVIIKNMVKTGMIDEARINNSYQRIQQFKRRLHVNGG